MEGFFGLQMPLHSIAGMSFALALAVLLGALIGLERQLNGHPAGLRTHILVCLGSTLITLASAEIAAGGKGPADPGRIAAQIVSGIGFLGAGAIVREGITVRGLTTAASLWATAGIGISVGAGPRFAQLGVIAAAIVVFTLWILHLVDDWIDGISNRVILLRVRTRDTERAAANIFSSIATHGIVVQDAAYEPSGENKVQQMRLHLRPPRGFSKTRFLSDLSEGTGVLSVHLE